MEASHTTPPPHIFTIKYACTYAKSEEFQQERKVPHIASQALPPNSNFRLKL